MSVVEEELSTLLVEMPEGRVLAYQAPTGSGKSLSVLGLLSSLPMSSLMIVPNKNAVDFLSSFFCSDDHSQTKNVHVMHGHHALDDLLNIDSCSYKYIIIDEIHTLSCEYISILYLLRYYLNHCHLPLRVIFLSATIPFTYLKRWFPGMICSISSHVDTLYPVDVNYSEGNHSPFYTIFLENCLQMMRKRIEDIFQEKEKEKVLCFLPTHDSCEVMTQWLQNRYSCPILLYHGGLEEDEKRMIQRQWKELDCFIMVTTNIAESVVTIPDLDIVVDSGVECRMVTGTNIIEMTYCTKQSLQQRAGRVGRTKRGKVFRLMTLVKYESLQECHSPSLSSTDMEPFLLKLWFRRLCLEQIVDPQQYVPFLRVLENHDLREKKGLLQLIERMGVQIQQGVYLSKVSLQMNLESVGFVMTIALLDFCVRKRPRWIYFPKDVPRTNLVQKVQDRFFTDEDSCLCLLRMFCYVFSSSFCDWRKRAQTFSFNQRAWKDCWSHVRSCSLRFFQCSPSDWKRTWSAFLSLYCPDEILSQTWETMVKTFFWSSSVESSPPISCHDHSSIFDTSMYHTYSIMYSPMLNYWNRPNPSSSRWARHVIPICFSSSLGQEDILIWTFVPMDGEKMWREFTEKLQEKEKKEECKQWFQNHVIREIREEVSYRPGMVNMLQHQSSFEDMCRRIMM